MSIDGPTTPPAEGTITLLSPVKPGLSIRSILLIMLLSVSIFSSIVVGLIGYVNGRDSLRDAAFDRLIEVRDSRATAIGSLFDTIKSSVLLASRSRDAIEAVQAFSTGFQELETDPLSDEDRATLTTYYTDDFAPRLAAATGDPSDPATFIPTDNAESYLKLHYTVPFPTFEAALANNDAGDGSAWSAAHAQYHDYFRRLTTLNHYEDTLLLDAQGNVVYSAFKGVDLGTNIVTGPFRFSNLAVAYSDVMSGNVLDTVKLTDFANYAPSLNVPAGWAVAPIGVDAVVIGAIAVELPIDTINSVMTGDHDWVASGLGATGETYLVGAGDQLMRSPSRDLIEDPKKYAKLALAAGIPSQTVDQAVTDKDTLLVQPVNTVAVRAAEQGKSGTTLAPGYLGGETLAAYAPLESLGNDGLNWVIVAEIDSAEAFAPVDAFTRNLVLSSAVIVLVVSLLSLVMAGVIVRPLRRLRDAARRISAGEQGVQVDAGRSDELADVAVAFNDMSRSLQVKAALLEEQQNENERLLLSLMPETMVKKYKEGAQTIALDHQEVTVMFADIVGFESFSRDLPSEQALELLNEILSIFDEAADRFGIERVRTTRAGYLASCGMTIPRVDNARRTVDFAMELQRILERFGGKHGASLNLRAGVDTGTVTSGLIGQGHIAYDMWGDAVSIAFQIQGGNPEPGIFLTQSVVDRLPDSVHVSAAGKVKGANGEEAVWRIDSDSAPIAPLPEAGTQAGFVPDPQISGADQGESPATALPEPELLEPTLPASPELSPNQPSPVAPMVQPPVVTPAPPTSAPASPSFAPPVAPPVYAPPGTPVPPASQGWPPPQMPSTPPVPTQPSPYSGQFVPHTPIPGEAAVPDAVTSQPDTDHEPRHSDD
ncbi:MAG: adenylate/guanylate cyclase domain-containing protein [Rhodoglobus sp.]